MKVKLCTNEDYMLFYNKILDMFIKAFNDKKCKDHKFTGEDIAYIFENGKFTEEDFKKCNQKQ